MEKMMKSLIAGETGALDAVDFVGRMKQRRDKLFAYYSDLYSQVDSAMIRFGRYILLFAATGLIAVAVLYRFPKFFFLVTLLFALFAIPTAGLCIYTALSTLHNLNGVFKEGVIMADEFRHELQNFKNSDAGREIASCSPLRELEILPNFTRLTRFSNFMLWYSVAASAVILVAAFVPLLYVLFSS